MARKFWRNDPDELFNECWMKYRERELKGLSPNDPVNYFIRMMHNTATDWRKQRKTISIDEVVISEQVESKEISRGDKLLEWVESPPTNKEEEFLKNIIFLALRCKDINEASRVSEMSRFTFWKYKKKAIEYYEKQGQSVLAR